MTAATLGSGLLKWAASAVLLVPGDLDKPHSRAILRNLGVAGPQGDPKNAGLRNQHAVKWIAMNGRK